jgi:hypothetical protein
MDDAKKASRRETATSNSHGNPNYDVVTKMKGMTVKPSR